MSTASLFTNATGQKIIWELMETLHANGLAEFLGRFFSFVWSQQEQHSTACRQAKGCVYVYLGMTEGR